MPILYRAAGTWMRPGNCCSLKIPHEKVWNRAPQDLRMASGIGSLNCPPVGKLPTD